ncbi:hypothetical protein H0H87_002845 [Tephrocybe sp. NHM501043]|nr:hypothetical protein H0H87_002845 [Tephrocybe sp. NHM501043]
MSPPSRISLAGYLGTVRYTGPVEGTSGTWLGIEWDDPNRGKHDGVKDGIRYFTCCVPNSGSFVRPSSNVSYGQSFLEALTTKYIETPHGSASQEQVILGSSQGNIVVEAVNLDKIRGKLADLSRLREVSLDGLDVATCDAPGMIQQTCPSIRGLDLSRSLLPDWDVVASVARDLPVLKRLCLNQNRLLPATSAGIMKSAFLNLTELQLNGTMMPWSELQNATAAMPKLEVIEMGYNSLTYLHTADECPPVNNTVRVINLDGNSCSDWVHIWKSIQHYTLIQTWSDVDALSSWCPGIEALTLSGNPLTSQTQARHSRPFTISKIPTLEVLDGAEISHRERIDSELLYLSAVAQELHSENDRLQAHPQWLNLCKRHGRPDDCLKVDTRNKLSERLTTLNLYRSVSTTAFDLQQTLDTHAPLLLRVLPTMTLRALRMKMCKMLKVKASILLWLQQSDGTFVELDIDRDDQTMDWLGLEDSTDLVFHTVYT